MDGGWALYFTYFWKAYTNLIKVTWKGCLYVLTCLNYSHPALNDLFRSRDPSDWPQLDCGLVTPSTRESSAKQVSTLGVRMTSMRGKTSTTLMTGPNNSRRRQGDSNPLGYVPWNNRLATSPSRWSPAAHRWCILRQSPAKQECLCLLKAFQRFPGRVQKASRLTLLCPSIMKESSEHD